SETAMAPRPGSTGEDDGYLVTITTDMNADRSECWVFDAARVGDGPVCRVRLPERVSSGTHATWAAGESIAGWRRADTLAGVRRYGQWLELLPISNAVLTDRLARLSRYGLLRRVAYQERPPRYEYRLTRRGRDIWPVLLAIWAWELRWVPEHAERLPGMVH